MPYSSLAIANEFIDRATKAGQPLTNMQLQKLVYLAHGFNLAINNKPLVEESVEAWNYGTVYRRLYDALKFYGPTPVIEMIRWGDDTPTVSGAGEYARESLQPEEDELITRVWQLYGHFPAFKLSAITHEDRSPWKKCYEPGRNRAIPDNDIRDYFCSLIENKVESQA